MKRGHCNQMIKLRAAAGEALIILLTAVIVACIFNFLRPHGLSLFGFSSPVDAKKENNINHFITLAETYNLYQKNKVIFVDARDPFSFEEGHIAGAVNIYPDEVNERIAGLKKMISSDSVVVTYCDGPECLLSKNTAHALRSQGISVVKVLVDGWRLWLTAGYPVTKGKYETQ